MGRNCHRKSHPTRQQAETALARTRGAVRVYFCWDCQAWHVTSQQLTDPPVLQDEKLVNY